MISDICVANRAGIISTMGLVPEVPACEAAAMDENNNSKPPIAAAIAELTKRRDEVRQYFRLFVAAFDELHAAVVAQVARSPSSARSRHDYPVMSFMSSGFPSFSKPGALSESVPLDFVSAVRPQGLLAALVGGGHLPRGGLPKGMELASFLHTNEIGRSLNLQSYFVPNIVSDVTVDRLVNSAVEHYLHVYGLLTPINHKNRDALIWSLINGTLQKSRRVRLIVPIALTHFDIDYYPLNAGAYIVRIPEKIQLARARMPITGSGAAENVVGAATHAFVSTDWTLETTTIDEVSQSLNVPSQNVLDAIDAFFGALRLVTGIKTGYAQFGWLPRRWALDYFCDLPPIYGAAIRRYPADFDNFGWAHDAAHVTKTQLLEVRQLYNAIVDNQEEAIWLSLTRLNGCLTRVDPADAIVDGTIGLEMLLGDDQNQSLSYKLRLRAAALAIHYGDPEYTAAKVAADVKQLYAARSAIVHGKRKKTPKSASLSAENAYSKERLIASELLRFVLKVILLNPKYLNPAKIDEGLLLRGDDADP